VIVFVPLEGGRRRSSASTRRPATRPLTSRQGGRSLRT
jgi:hypothetical protein